MNKIKTFFSDWTMFEKCWLVLSAVTMVVLSLVWGDSLLALLSGLAGIISVVLCAKGKILNYAFGLVQAVTYAYICFEQHIYGEVMYNIIMVPIIIIGFFSWKKNMASDHAEVKARNLTAKGWVILIVGSIAAVAAYCGILNLLGGEFALVDATSTVLSMIASILMVARYSEQWVMWVVVNVVSVVLWFLVLIKGDMSAVTLLVMWSAYLLNSTYGYVNWRKMAKENG